MLTRQNLTGSGAVSHHAYHREDATRFLNRKLQLLVQSNVSPKKRIPYKDTLHMGVKVSWALLMHDTLEGGHMSQAATKGGDINGESRLRYSVSHAWVPNSSFMLLLGSIQGSSLLYHQNSRKSVRERHFGYA